MSMQGRRLRRLAFVPALSLYPFVPALIPEAYAQLTCFTPDGSPTPCAVAPTASASQVQGIAAASQGIIRDAVRGDVVIIDQHLRDIGRDLARGQASGPTAGRHGSSGLSAGSEPVSFAAWIDASGSYLANDSAGNAYQGRSVTALSGIDAVIGTSWVAGLSAGYSSAALSVGALGGTRTSSGAIVGPYASYMPIDYVGHAEKWDEIAVEGDVQAKDCLLHFKRGGRTLAVASIFRDVESLKIEAEMEQRPSAANSRS